MLTLSTNSLRAALHCVATKDFHLIRQYLNGVNIEVTAKAKEVYIVSTDGNVMFACRQDAQWADVPQIGPWSIIIPTEIVKQALARSVPWRLPAVKGIGRLPDIALTATPDGRYMLGNVAFAPIDGKFPDWRRITPRGTMSNDAAFFDPEIMLRAHKALADFHGLKDLACNITYNGDRRAALLTRGDDAYCVVMPWTVDRADAPFTLDVERAPTSDEQAA